MDDSESGGDFSTSEDDWVPPKNDQSDSSDFEGDAENESAKLPAKKRKRITKTERGTSNSTSNSLRSRLYQKYNPPKTSILSLKINENNFSANKNVKKRNICEDNAESSDSSGDDYLVDPNELDLKSSFFDVNIAPEASKLPVQIDEDESGPSSSYKKFGSEVINKISSEKMNNLQEYCQTFEDAKLHLKNFNSESFKDTTCLDVQQLLAMGEGTSNSASTSTTHKKRKKIQNCSDSEWDEVEDIEECKDSPQKKIAVDGLQITVKTMQTAKPKDNNCIEAMLKRKINRVIKEKQIYFHKSTLLCHIAHGIYCNKILNIPSLMAMALKLLPNGSNCYPNGRTEIKYFESMAKWYSTAITLKNEAANSNLKKSIKLKESLSLQIKNKAANSKKDFVLIFIILLRAMGIQCRLVMNLVPLPLKPPQSDLCSLKQDKNSDDKKNSKKSKKGIAQANEICSSSKVTGNIKAKGPASTATKKITVSEKPKTITKEVEQQKTKDKKVSDTKNIKATNSNPKTIDKPKNIDSGIKVTSKITPKVGQIENSGSVLSIKKQPEKGSLRTCEPHTSKEGSKLSLSSIGKRKNVNISKLTACSSKTESPTEKGKLQIEKNIVSSHFPKIDSNTNKNNESTVTTGVTRRTTRSKAKLLIPQLDGADEIADSKQSRPSRKRTNLKTLKVTSQNRPPAKDSDDEFVPSPPKKPKLGKIATLKRLDKRVLSTDVDDETETKPRKKGMDVWVEVFSETEEKWVTIDLFKSKVHCVDNIRRAATLPIAYVFAWNNDNSLKDVSARYCLQWHTVTRKLRVDQSWLDDTIEGYRGIKNSRDFAEDRELHKLHLDKPLPTTISEFKNHPLYVLQRHLLKFEAIYPPDALTLGFIRGEPVYSRDCVHNLHSREIWLKSARVVKPKEEPYKIVKARPKWDKYSNTVIKDQPLEIFGYWQTMDYDPPTAENGIVPRNAYGNVELFKKCMLPKKTVHLQLPGLAKICKKLEVDCAPAVIGFDFHSGSCHPMLDGFVICEEFADSVIAAWNEYQDDMAKREEEKYQQRVYGNWKKLIKGLFIREKLKRRYNFQGGPPPDAAIKAKKKK